MLPRADLSTNRPPGAVEAPTPATSATDTRQEVFRRLNQIAIGKELSATVQARLEDGSHLVKIGDAAARMVLPAGTRVGDQFSMVFIAREPRPTFLLNGQAGSANASLSAAARLIDHLLHGARGDSAAMTVRGSTPLLPGPMMDAAQLAGQLQRALASSGLFYESHLQEWVVGSRSKADLAREPQAAFAQPRQAPAPDGQEIARLAAGLKELGEGAQALLRMMRDAQRHAGMDADLLARTPAPLPALDPELGRLIQMQLNTLEQQQIRWQGQLFPGQEMEWDVTEERSQDDPDNHDASAWTSVVRFELPHLGPVEAVLRLAGDRVQAEIRAEKDASAAA
ncbi:MAG TPA: flagellar hook-length control protein FliK, partial [Noviherbaspirillum sp.]|nr:flagellar hook-length control protein FliK [Noviherbaspirillum sp.]